ncbi:hypothetical protein N185_17270 [Sinorhizobium sp. GW3]|nr:hypothetical protein N185_17270 [Sinorhizobium sp. GW3]
MASKKKQSVAAVSAGPDIRIEMFEVQLGSALFLQFRTLDGNVNVLADAGIKASGYDVGTVHGRLSEVLNETGSRHLDLIIGTHYDEDHLAGLVPVIQDTTITIGEAWMPPVANDVKMHPFDVALRREDLLPFQFYDDVDGSQLVEYLEGQRSDLDRVAVFTRHPDQRTVFNEILIGAGIDRLGALMSGFHATLEASEGTDSAEHGEEQIDEEGLFPPRRPLSSYWHYRRFIVDLEADPPHPSDISEAQMYSLVSMERSTAKKAINAKALYDVVQALKARNVLMRSEIIEDGTPKIFTWDRLSKRFVERGEASNSPSLKLLGPSRSLVQKHWDKLPVGDALGMAFTHSVALKSITPSNQLSYVMRFEHRQQGILVTGDAGMVDFREDRNAYSPSLLSALLPLHVIQVAHHGGANAHFYRVLNAAKYPEQPDTSYLLLSHATEDKYRPSIEFRDFVMAGRSFGDDIVVLFTSRPSASKVAGYESAIWPAVGKARDVGDIRLEFDKSGWKVVKHSVAP